MNEAIKLLKRIKSLPTTLMYRRSIKRKEVEFYTFANTSFNIAAGLEPGQTGVVVDVSTPEREQGSIPPD